MSRSYELNYGNKHTVNIGNYENLNPMYNAKLIITVEDGIEVNLNEEFNIMREIVDLNLKNNVRGIKDSLKAKENAEALKQFRFYDKDGKKYISVTSVLNPDLKTPEEIERLKPYGEKGDAQHKLFENAIKTGKIDDLPKELSWIFKDVKIDLRRSEFRVYDDKTLTAGTCDADGYYDDKLTGYDLKSGNLTYKDSLVKAKEQLAEYWNADGKKWEQAIILPTHEKVKQEPIIISRDELVKHLESFMKKRNEFRERYGV